MKVDPDMAAASFAPTDAKHDAPAFDPARPCRTRDELDLVNYEPDSAVARARAEALEEAAREFQADWIRDRIRALIDDRKEGDATSTTTLTTSQSDNLGTTSNLAAGGGVSGGECDAAFVERMDGVTPTKEDQYLRYGHPSITLVRTQDWVRLLAIAHAGLAKPAVSDEAVEAVHAAYMRAAAAPHIRAPVEMPPQRVSDEDVNYWSVEGIWPSHVEGLARDLRDLRVAIRAGKEGGI